MPGFSQRILASRTSRSSILADIVIAYREAICVVEKLDGAMLTPVISPVSSASTPVFCGRISYLPRPMNSARTLSVSIVSRLKIVVRFANVGMPIV